MYVIFHSLSCYLDFTSFIKTSFIESLAQADEFELVKSVQEYFIDFIPVSHNHFTLHIPIVMGDQSGSWNSKYLVKCTESLGSVLLALKKAPIIRYDKYSHMASKMAHQLNELVRMESKLFEVGRPQIEPILLILDRRTDLMTPFIQPWTFQAMIHELFGIRNGRVKVNKCLLDSTWTGNVATDEEYVLVAGIDEFFSENQYNNYGELGNNLKSLIDYLQKHHQESTSQMESFSEMRQFMNEYAEYQKLASISSKHSKLCTLMMELIKRLDLFSLSEMEQTIMMANNLTDNLRDQVYRLLEGNHKINQILKRRIITIYALKFRNSSLFNIMDLNHFLKNSLGWTDYDLQLLDFTIRCSVADLGIGMEEMANRTSSTFSSLRLKVS